MTVIILPWTGTAVCITLGGRAIDNMRRSQILVENHNFSLVHLHSMPSKYRHNVWYEKTRMVWLPNGEKILKICLLVSTEYMNVTDRQTDRQMDTVERHRLHLCIASCGNNINSANFSNILHRISNK